MYLLEAVEQLLLDGKPLPPIDKAVEECFAKIRAGFLRLHEARGTSLAEDAKALYEWALFMYVYEDEGGGTDGSEPLGRIGIRQAIANHASMAVKDITIKAGLLEMERVDGAVDNMGNQFNRAIAVLAKETDEIAAEQLYSLMLQYSKVIMGIKISSGTGQYFTMKMQGNKVIFNAEDLPRAAEIRKIKPDLKLEYELDDKTTTAIMNAVNNALEDAGDSTRLEEPQDIMFFYDEGLSRSRFPDMDREAWEDGMKALAETLWTQFFLEPLKAGGPANATKSRAIDIMMSFNPMELMQAGGVVYKAYTGLYSILASSTVIWRRDFPKLDKALKALGGITLPQVVITGESVENLPKTTANFMMSPLRNAPDYLKNFFGLFYKLSGNNPYKMTDIQNMPAPGSRPAAPSRPASAPTAPTGGGKGDMPTMAVPPPGTPQGDMPTMDVPSPGREPSRGDMPTMDVPAPGTGPSRGDMPTMNVPPPDSPEQTSYIPLPPGGGAPASKKPPGQKFVLKTGPGGRPVLTPKGAGSGGGTIVKPPKPAPDAPRPASKTTPVPPTPGKPIEPGKPKFGSGPVRREYTKDWRDAETMGLQDQPTGASKKGVKKYR